MKKSLSLVRKSHFLGTKIRNLRKRNRLTMEDLSARCIKINAETAPSVSYLSMIERGKRVPSEEMLEVIAQVFQKDMEWFLDDTSEEKAITPHKDNRGGISGMALEPSILFSKDILQIAIPELLVQSGTSGRQFAHLLIRAYQEHYQNHFPDLERTAEEIGLKRMPLSLEDMFDIMNRLGLEIRWFNQSPAEVSDESGAVSKNLTRSYFELPNQIYLNRTLKSDPARLKYDLAVHIGHCILHGKDGVKSPLIAGKNLYPGKQQETSEIGQANSVGSLDILHAWRDFECSFFAGALLCPKVPFRQLLDRHSYETNVNEAIGVSPSVTLRRMTAVSPYPYWHYFDAYAPGSLKAVYRGNGIPLPWGNIREVEDVCLQWSVFDLIRDSANDNIARISIMNTGQELNIYCCQSIRVKDLAGNKHVLSVGVDLKPAMASQGLDSASLLDDLKIQCLKQGGSAKIPKSIQAELLSVARILNIAWVERSLQNEAQIICPRKTVCQRKQKCYLPQ